MGLEVKNEMRCQAKDGPRGSNVKIENIYLGSVRGKFFGHFLGGGKSGNVGLTTLIIFLKNGEIR